MKKFSEHLRRSFVHHHTVFSAIKCHVQLHAQYGRVCPETQENVVMLKVELSARISQRDLAHAIGTTPRAFPMLHATKSACKRSETHCEILVYARTDFAAGKREDQKEVGNVRKSGVKRQNMGTRRDGHKRAALTESQTCQRRLKRLIARASKPGKNRELRGGGAAPRAANSASLYLITG